MPSKSQKIFLLFMDFAKKKKKTSSESLDTETEKNRFILTYQLYV